jgi:hypothetical protein
MTSWRRDRRRDLTAGGLSWARRIEMTFEFDAAFGETFSPSQGLHCDVVQPGAEQDAPLPGLMLQRLEALEQ